MIINLKLFSSAALSTLLVSSFTAHAQKLPGIQANSLRAPADIKIDGKATEWHNQFQAYNRATSVYYTLANDDDNLYVAIQVKDQVVIRKILGGSMVFTVNRSVKKDDEHVALTFPLLPGGISGEIGAYLKQRIALKPVKTGDVYSRDSLLMLMNTTLINNIKQVKIKGVKQLADTMLSVYNAAGIKVRALFDTNNALTCELAIPVKYLGLPGPTPARFSYHLKLNEMYANVGAPVDLDGNVLPAGSYTLVYSGTPAERQTLMNATDFWGEYTLVK